PGTYYDTLTSVAGCDSIVETILDVVPEIRNDMAATICDGDSYPYNGGFVSTAGFYRDTLMSSGGCDSIITLDLDVIIAMDVTDTPVICEGDSIFLGGAWQTEAGTYLDTLQSQLGCDSLIITSILEVSNEIEVDLFLTLCPGDTLYGISLFADTMITQMFSTNGCDSTVNSFVTIADTFFTTIDETICEGDSIWTGLQWITETDTITESYLTIDGCDSTITYRVTVLDTIMRTRQRVICEGDSILIDGVWQTEPGTYMATYAGSNGCDSTVATILETRPCFVEIIGSDLPCPGDTSGSITINVVGLEFPILFDWSSLDSAFWGSGVIAATGPVTITGLGAGIYQVNLQDTLGTFSGQYTVTVTEPDAIVASFDVITTIDCPGAGTGFVEVDVSGGSPGYTFQWSNGSTDPDQGPLGVGLYTVTITDAAGCVLVDSVNINDAPGPEFEPFVIDVSCAGEMDGSILVETVNEVRPPYLYSIDGFTFQEENVFNGLGAGAYDIIIRDSLGCTYELSAVIVEEPSELELYVIPRDTIELGDSVQLFVHANFDIVSIEWDPGTGLSCTDCVDPWASPKDDQVYMVTAWDENGCSAQALIVINVRKDRDIYIPNVFSPNGDGINDFFTAYGGEQVKEIVELELFDRWGELVFRTQHIPISEPELGWDGFFRKEVMNPAVFVYVIKICWLDGYEGIFAGDVTLIR
ncbi:MAG: gliding motility-associated C-terminal domain-containing protein, partial [Saprospiraceae bacterium]|nr:gliding motility-associated C-terminal domain-containing protein [Saprospiraceae bacterium]